MWIFHARISAIAAETVVLLLCNQTHALAHWCRDPPRAGHYFATYLDNSRVMKLHFEHLHCGGQAAFCREGTCLRQEYVSTGGHYQLKKSYYGRNND